MALKSWPCSTDNVFEVGALGAGSWTKREVPNMQTMLPPGAVSVTVATPAEHYAREAVIATALRWEEARRSSSSDYYDRASDLRRAVETYREAVGR